MFGLGFFEIILILVGILIFIRPQDLPAFVYRVGKVYGQIKEAYNKFYREVNIIKNQMDEMVEKQKSEVYERSQEKLPEIKVKDKSNNLTLSPKDSNPFKPEKNILGEGKLKKFVKKNDEKTSVTKKKNPSKKLSPTKVNKTTMSSSKSSKSSKSPKKKKSL